jgi:hypothetical protein
MANKDVFVDAPRTTVKRVRKVAPPPIPYTAEHYKIMRLASEAGLIIGTLGVHPSIAEVEKFATFANLAIEKHEAGKPKVLSPFVSRNELIAAVEGSRRKIDVCTPDRCWGSRSGDWRDETIEYVDVDQLLHALNNPEGE